MLKKLYKNKIISTINLIDYIIRILSSQNKKITFAESCTGGLLSYYFTKENGTSKILDGSLITYANDLKENWLAVQKLSIDEHGAVSSVVVEEMSEGALDVSHADYAISISGIAGIGGGTKEKPVGSVYTAIKIGDKIIENHYNFSGNRNVIRKKTTLEILQTIAANL